MRPEIRFRPVVIAPRPLSVAGPRTDATSADNDVPAVRLRYPGRRRVSVGRRRLSQAHVPDTSAAPVAPPALSAAAAAAVHVRRSPPTQRRRATDAVRAGRPSVPAAAAAAASPSSATVALFVGAGAGPDHDPGPVPQPQRSP